MRNIVLILLISYAGFVSGQQTQVENLQQQIEDVIEDTLKVHLLLELSDIYFNGSKPDSALLLAHQGLELAKSINYKNGVIQGTRRIASRSWRLGDFSTAIKSGYSLLEIAKSSNDTSLLTSSYVFLANSYRDQGDYREALSIVFKHLFIRKAKKDTDLGVTYAAIASNYYGLKKYDSASYYLKIALSQPKGFAYGWILLIKARTEAQLKNYEIALDYYHQSIRQLRIENNDKDLAGAYASIATLFTEVEQADSAIFYGEQALNLAKQKNFNKELFEAYLILSKANEKENLEDALSNYKLAMDEKDNLFNQEKQRQITSYKFNDVLRQNEIKSAEQLYKSNIRTNTLAGSLFTLAIIAFFLYRNSRLNQRAKIKIENAFDQLKATQTQLIQSEKMASLGELTAGIAHEIQNPLNFVNNFSELNFELAEELREEIKNRNNEEADKIVKDIIENEKKIKHHGQRAEGIVKGMLMHSRTSKGEKEPTDINALADEYMRLAYHGMRAKDKSLSADFKTDFDPNLPKVNVVPQDIGRVLLNLINNAFQAVAEVDNPMVVVSTKKLDKQIEIKVSDNGPGIPEEIKDKIFQPFFTTKPTGSGTGLGLSLSYDIVKGHGGTFTLDTSILKGAAFIIQFPINSSSNP